MALLFTLLLGVVFVVEVLTPDDVVGAVAVLPLVGAVWVLSSRFAAMVALVAALLFGLTLMLEPGNRVSVAIMGTTTLVTALVARLYARSLAALLALPRQSRPGVATTTSVTFAGRDRCASGTGTLTRRDLEVARLDAQGYTSGESGKQLQIGEGTVESHLANTYKKLRIRSKRELIRMASTLGQ